MTGTSKKSRRSSPRPTRRYRRAGRLSYTRSIIDDDRSQNTFGLLMSLNMLIETRGGFDYTASDCMGWMRTAGFTTTRVVHLLGPDSMVIGIK